MRRRTHSAQRHPRAWLVTVIVTVIAFAGCGGSGSKAGRTGDQSATASTSAAAQTTSAAARPVGTDPADTAPATTSTVPATVPGLTLPAAPWSGPPVAAGGLTDLAAWWYTFYGDSGCPLLASNAAPGDIGAVTYPKDGWEGTAGGGPFIVWPGPAGSPTLLIMTEGLDANDTTVGAFFSPAANVEVFADGSEERFVDGEILVLLPGVTCGYLFSTADAMVEVRNFLTSIRVIAPPAVLPAPGQPTSTPCPVGGVDVIRPRDGGTAGCPDISQAMLWLSRFYPNVTIDGVYHPGDEVFVRDFQASNGLNVDGLIGPTTWSYLSDSEFWDY